MAENLLLAQCWTGAKTEAGNLAHMDNREGKNIGGNPVFNLESLLIALRVNLVGGAPVHRDNLTQIQFRKHNIASIAIGKLDRNTITCLVDIYPKESHITSDGKPFEGRNSCLFKPVLNAGSILHG